MADEPLHAVYQALVDGDKAAARRQLQMLAQTSPSADVYYYGAFVAKDYPQAHALLRRALALEPLHAGANRLHMQLEKQGAIALDGITPDPPTTAPTPTAAPTINDDDLRRRRQSRGKRNRRSLFAFITVSVVLSIMSSWLVALLLGIASWATSPVVEAFGGQPAITAYDGTPIADIPNPAQLPAFPAALSTALPRGATNAMGEVLRDGTLHEYEFRAANGENLAVAVQFFSPFAENVPAHVAIFDPNGQIAERRCQREVIIDEITGAAYICAIDVSGTWKIRIYGREGASTGVYVITSDIVAE